MVDTVRGVVRVRKWPKKRGKPKHPHTLYMNAWFRDAQKKLKFQPSLFVDRAIKETKGSGLYPRDYMLHSLTKGFGSLIREDGSIMHQRQLGLYQVSFQGCVFQLDGDTAFAGGTTVTIGPWTPILQTTQLLNPANPSQILIPPGVNVVRLTGCMKSTSSATTSVEQFLRAHPFHIWADDQRTGSVSTAATITSPPFPVTAGTTLRYDAFLNFGRTLDHRFTFFGCEILDAEIPPFTP